MSSIILPKHIDCVITEAPKDGYYLMANTDTGWTGGLCVDFESKKFKITIIFDNDKVSLGYFIEFLKENGWDPE